jgi:CheY-like chemotaxis protein
MDASIPTIGFAGDLSDPWVAGIARALSPFKVASRTEPDGGIPWDAFEPDSGIKILVIHRSRLSSADVSRLEDLRRKRGPAGWPRIVLCVSPYVRYAEIERCAALVEVVTPEATAAEILPHQIERMLELTPGQADRSRRGGTMVEVVSSDYELRRVLREAAAHAGYRATDAPSLAVGPDAAAVSSGRTLTVWDVPMLEPRWEDRLERRGKLGPVLALLGFADREAVAQARDAGASACLDLPCALDDLIDALDRMARCPARPRAEPAHAAPAGPVARIPRPKSRVAPSGRGG